MKAYDILYKNANDNYDHRYPADGNALVKAITELVDMGYTIISVRITGV